MIKGTAILVPVRGQVTGKLLGEEEARVEGISDNGKWLIIRDASGRKQVLPIVVINKAS